MSLTTQTDGDREGLSKAGQSRLTTKPAWHSAAAECRFFIVEKSVVMVYNKLLNFAGVTGDPGKSGFEGGIVMNEEIRNLIAAADKAIKEERFDDLIEFYTDDAVLVVRPGLEVKGKEAIKKAFIKIAAYFKNSVVPTQGKMLMIEAGDTVLVLSQTLLDAENKDTSEYSMDRRATYVYRRVADKWLCAIDNSYGTTLLD